MGTSLRFQGFGDSSGSGESGGHGVSASPWRCLSQRLWRFPYECGGEDTLEPYSTPWRPYPTNTFFEATYRPMSVQGGAERHNLSNVS